MWTSYHNPHHEFEGTSFRTYLIYSLLAHLALLALIVWLRPPQATPGPMTVELREGVTLPSFDAPAPGAAASRAPTTQPVPAPVPRPSAPTSSAPRYFPSPASSYSAGSPAGSASGSGSEGGYSFPATPFPSQQRKHEPMGAGFSNYSGSRQ